MSAGEAKHSFKSVRLRRNLCHQRIFTPAGRMLLERYLVGARAHWAWNYSGIYFNSDREMAKEPLVNRVYFVLKKLTTKPKTKLTSRKVGR